VAIVNSPVPGFEGKVIGASFVDGTADVEQEAQLSYFARHGYEVIYAPTAENVEQDEDQSETPEGDAPEGPKPLEDQSKVELEATATAENVEFKNPINKPDLIALIEENRK
jgi:hypothetical protein